MPHAALRFLSLAFAAAFAFAAPAARAQSSSADATPRILALERLGRADPFGAATALDAMLPATAALSAQRLELLTVQGLMLAVAAPPEAKERTATLLDTWGRNPTAANAPAAAAAALLVRARSVARDGNLQRADLMMRDAMAKLPGNTTPRDRYRFVVVHGYILDRAGQLEQAVRTNHEALALADAQGELWQQSEPPPSWPTSTLARNNWSARAA